MELYSSTSSVHCQNRHPSKSKKLAIPRLTKHATQQPELSAVSVKIGYSVLGILFVEWRLQSWVNYFAWTFRQMRQEVMVPALNRMVGRAFHEALLDYSLLLKSSLVLRKNWKSGLGKMLMLARELGRC